MRTGVDAASRLRAEACCGLALATVLVALAADVSIAQPTAWPPLPTQEFIRGRAATTEDVNARRAVFVAAVQGVPVGHPIDITIPQYAYYDDGGVKVAVFVVQAEEAQGRQIVGARRFDGSEIVGLLADFELLGEHPPGDAAP